MRFNFLYYFDSKDLALTESKRQDLSTSASLSDVYKWTVYLKEEKRFIPLTFRSMTKNGDEHMRTFNEGDLRFNQHAGSFVFQDQTFQLKLENPEQLPGDWRSNLESYLVSAFKHN